MNMAGKILLFSVLSVFLLSKVDGSLLNFSLNEDEAAKETDAYKRHGLFGNLFEGIKSPSNVHVPPANIPSPSFLPEQALVQTFQVASNVQEPSFVPSKSLLGSLLNHGEKPKPAEFNTNWLNYALQKCSRVDPKSLTAILPTTENGLRVPKMYFFQNDTYGGLSWFEAQEWCTARGMNLLTVNDLNENKVIVDRLRKIMAGNIPLLLDVNPTAWWIGLNGLNLAATPTWVGDGTSRFVDWHLLEPLPPAIPFCGTYNQVATPDNIRMDARSCLAANTLANPQQNLRFICEVSDECTALFMSRLPTSYFHHHNNGHVHYNAAGVLPPAGGG